MTEFLFAHDGVVSEEKCNTNFIMLVTHVFILCTYLKHMSMPLMIITPLQRHFHHLYFLIVPL